MWQPNLCGGFEKLLGEFVLGEKEVAVLGKSDQMSCQLRVQLFQAGRCPVRGICEFVLKVKVTEKEFGHRVSELDPCLAEKR